VRILAFGSYDVRTHPRVGVLIDGLREHGADVREVNVPLGLSTAARVDLLRRPWRLPWLAVRLTRRWTALALRARSSTRTWRPDAVLVGYLGHFDVMLARRLFRNTPIVLDHLIFAADTAADRGESGAAKQALLRRLDAAAIGAADVVVLDTDEHASLLAESAPRAAGRVVVVPVGTTRRWFEAASATPSGEVLAVVFYGLYTPLQGAPVIGEAIGALADQPIRFTMIGTGQDLAATRALAAGNPNVTWHDWMEADELPGVVAAHDVCLGIFGTTAKARRVVPNKVFQGMAAGCAVLSSDTPPQRAALGDAALLLPAGDGAALAAALRALAADPSRLAAFRASARRLAADRFTPAAVTEPLHRRLQTMTTTSGRARSALPPLPPRAWLRYDVVAGILDRLRPATVLEMGCGQGSFGARLADRADYLGVEPDAQAAAVARSRIVPRGGSVLLGDQHVVPAGSTYDLVCAFEVLEHLEDDAAMLATWASFVRPGGHLLLSVPAWPHRFGPMDTHAGHYRRYTPEALTDLLTGTGLEPVTTRVYGWPLGYALEAVRNPIDARKLANESSGVSGVSMAERTASTGRTFQPPNRLVGTAVAVTTTPFRYLQRLAPTRGTGLVALARSA
jgi:glycosyltransferase involved in cell wall biosynthesis